MCLRHAGRLYLEAERIKYATRLPANQVPQNNNEVRRYYGNFTRQAASWSKPRRVVAKVEWHPANFIPGSGSSPPP
jgi:hypothetical protein